MASMCPEGRVVIPSPERPVDMSDLLNKLQWRYATKKMDPAKAVPEDKVERILEAVRLTATASGLQPYQVLLVTNPALREQI